jgi:putative flavoprotein involved in K+ transport
MPRTDTIIDGAGQAGLTLSRYLARAGHSHAILDRGRIGERWRSERWESLTLLTPNWLNRLHGGHAHPEADGYVRRDEFVDYLRPTPAPTERRCTSTRLSHASSPSMADFAWTPKPGRRLPARRG